MCTEIYLYHKKLWGNCSIDDINIEDYYVYFLEDLKITVMMYENIYTNKNT